MHQSSIYAFLKAHRGEFKSRFKNGLVILCEDRQSALSCGDVAKFLGFETFVLPDFRAKFGDDLRSYQEELCALFATLRDFYAHKGEKVLFSPLYTLLHSLPNAESLCVLKLKVGDILNLKNFKENLLHFSYEFVDLVELSGEVSIRGDIIDILTPNSEEPYRITLFDEEVESVRHFDSQTQLCSKEPLESLEISPAFLNLDAKTYEALKFAITELPHKQSMLDLGGSGDVLGFGFWCLEKIGIAKDFLSEYPFVVSSSTKDLAKEVLSFNEYSAKKLQCVLNGEILDSTQEYQDFNYNFNTLQNFLELHKMKTITILAKSEAQARQAKIPLDAPYNFKFGVDYAVNLLGKEILILSLNTPQRQKKRTKTRILLDELKVGDYVVHSDYGIAIFSGITQTNIFGATRDFITLRYLGEDKLLLPVENLDRIDRYIADGGGIPLLDRLGKGSFAKLKEKVREKLFVIANAIVALAAKRELIDGVVCNVQKEEILIFQNQSGFHYTQDQTQAIEEIFKDISSGRVMDRLLSGDVGFGKTEVAMNAMFVMFLNGYQSAMIAPTTLLTYQHFNTLKDRFAPFGLRLARLDRYVGTKEKKQILRDLKEGNLNAVVGTHTLLNVEFKNLALMIVDEEHKFGVKQKEKIKDLSQNIHLLSMSATPIPRTLNMALSHIKGLSELKTPPSERQATRTFIKHLDDTLLKEVIMREMRRGGQVFYIHNNIATIKQKKEEILRVLPKLNIAILHSQIPVNEAEDIVLEFAKGGYHILLCTSIVESGIHLPNANTILVDNANCFGIADLHQLRGRVGRGNKEGFCYLLVEDFNAITEDAKKRLLALEKNSFLGSGGALAYHDLEIRGGGNLLGEAQSGHIKNIGYSLYLRMLEDAIFALSGNMKQKEANVDIKLSVTAFLNPELIESERLRLEIYRRLSKCENEKAIFGIEGEIEERFGRLDVYTRQFLDLIRIKIIARNCGIANIMNYQQNITFTQVNGEKTSIKASSKDEDDVLKAVFIYLEKLNKGQ
ncbi:transcription-repair coupling factor [Helicobacter turcicus]|uniref:Transcription-repair-coupling factor n=1 Tax=Helicobacter turcicus TaxID=2867412 RepID=A0ABS7JPI3_9HELI|nr:transcription-repair coupling factor [Helicobacter turcicus]MBX7491324.1 transcription-repair coupling factor [Helicobacter turcicus]MBX7546189.1 transcription-repair coupling factor [Helicobacter turcicus]